MSVIEVERDAGGYRDRLRAYRVLVNGQEMGRIRRGEHLLLAVPPGNHEVVLKIDWARSPVLPLSLSARETVKLRCSPNGGALSVLYWITFGYAKYIRLERLQSQ